MCAINGRMFAAERKFFEAASNRRRYKLKRMKPAFINEFAPFALTHFALRSLVGVNFPLPNSMPKMSVSHSKLLSKKCRNQKSSAQYGIRLTWHWCICVACPRSQIYVPKNDGKSAIVIEFEQNPKESRVCLTELSA